MFCLQAEPLFSLKLLNMTSKFKQLIVLKVKIDFELRIWVNHLPSMDEALLGVQFPVLEKQHQQ